MRRVTGYKKGTPFHEALLDGWCRNLPYEQRIQELREIGFDADYYTLSWFDIMKNKEMDMFYKRENLLNG